MLLFLVRTSVGSENYSLLQGGVPLTAERLLRIRVKEKDRGTGIKA